VGEEREKLLLYTSYYYSIGKKKEIILKIGGGEYRRKPFQVAFFD
jgi:hypothetical protein